MSNLREFYNGKRVFITGHTGFKGTWLTRMLLLMGADVTGYSLEPPTDPSLFEMSETSRDIAHIIGDVRDREKLVATLLDAKPDIVLHLAAQPIVRESYKYPAYTYETNVMGTVNICEAVRLSDTVKSFLNVTTDKVYLNDDIDRPEGFREDEQLDGYDPYSNSKSCSELVTHSYIRSFFNEKGIAVSTARAGNVIGGGDYAIDRIIPDCVRAAEKGETIIVRSPYSIRPYQHVLEPLRAYLMIAMEQYEDKSKAGYYNVGPDDTDCIETGKLVDLFCKAWGEGASWEERSDGGPHEATFLKLNCDKLKETFSWEPSWNIEKAVRMVVQFEKAKSTSSAEIREEMEKEINEMV
ncbi:MAG: CDP-glucose 4,6-dehydratase [Eubacterium sp.]|nr:CDP-glucose 4,6-dehydratase [Eubacterium sp.]